MWGTTLRPKRSSGQTEIKNTTHLEKGAIMTSLLPSAKTIATSTFLDAHATRKNNSKSQVNGPRP